eukprot:scaffold681840_cov45-Prasinocladus_malaysianus.AAC.1
MAETEVGMPVPAPGRRPAKMTTTSSADHSKRIIAKLGTATATRPWTGQRGSCDGGTCCARGRPCRTETRGRMSRLMRPWHRLHPGIPLRAEGR